MKQILQHLRSGELEVAEVPAPQVTPGHVLIQTRASLISAGTERMLVEFAKGSLVAKARSQPDKVKQVLDKMKTDGLMPTLEAVFNRLDEPMPLGYCNAGVVVEVGPGVHDLKPGDRVASNGPHAELVCVPRNLCAKIPEGVSDDRAAFTVISSIGLQGIRLLKPTLGERFVVYGMGLIGLVATQLLQAHGCEVLGVDLSSDRLASAAAYGAATCNPAEGGNPADAAMAWTGGVGVDGVLIAASAKTDEIVHLSAEMCRKRGRIVLVGVVGLDLRRSDFYEKELSFQVSCSYGPGRYDDRYEQAGQDYPLPYVRWTEGRNFEAVLGAMAAGRLRVDDLVTHHVPQAEAQRAYAEIEKGGTGLGVILDYPAEVAREKKVVVKQRAAPASGKAVVGVVGAGLFSKSILMPALAKSGAEIAYVCDLKGDAARHLATKFGAGAAVTDYKEVLNDDRVNAVITAVGHSAHCTFVCETLEAGKHAFVEKPLGMNVEEVRRIVDTAKAHPDRLVMVGFNRRFSPHLVKMKELLRGRAEPLAMSMTVNAGFIPPDHWVHDPVRGGGRIIGEGCHFIDLLAFLADSPVETVSAAQMGGTVAVHEDKMSIVLGFADGSVGAVNYFANGSKAYPKERIEVFSDKRVLVMDNFRRTEGHGFGGFKKFKTSRQDKGHAAEFAAFAERVATGGEPLIPLDRLVNATLASFAAMTAAAEKRTVVLAEEYDL